MGRWCVRYGWIGGWREKVSGVYRFSSLVKQHKKAKICFVIHIAGERFFFNICDVITSPEKEKSSANHYSPPITSRRIPTQPTTSHSRRGRTGRERHDVEVDVDEGDPRAQTATDSAACETASHQLQAPQGRGPAPAQDRRAAPRGLRRAAPGTGPRR
jgi:hypothetical protein